MKIPGLVSIPVVFLVLLAGCADSGDAHVVKTSSSSSESSSGSISDSSTSSSSAPELRPERIVDATNCREIAAAHAVPREEFANRLPETFEPVGFGFWVGAGDDIAEEFATIGSITAECSSSELGEGSVGFSIVSGVVKEPANTGLEPAGINFFVFSLGVNDPSLQEIFEEYEWTVAEERGVEVFSILETGPGPGASYLTAEVVEGGETIMTASTVGHVEFATTYPDRDFILRFWSEGKNGLTFIEGVLDQDGRTGVLDCEYVEGGAFERHLGSNRCADLSGFAVSHSQFNLRMKFPAEG